MARVFLSSVTEDRPAMRRLAEALRRAGHDPWIDVDRIRCEEIPAEELERDKGMVDVPWWNAVNGAVEASDMLIIGYSTATHRRQLAWEYTNAFWTAAAAGKPAFMARLDEVPLWFKMIGAHVFDLRRTSWERDVGTLIAALDRPTSVFVGREPELTWLAHHLRTTAQAAVVGDAGVGKNALVAEYAQRHAAEYPGGCVVIDAGHGKPVAGAALGALERQRPRLAIIEDVADDAWTGLYPWGGAEHVIVTARARPASFSGPVLELAPLSLEDASLVFDSRAGHTDDPAEIQKRREIVAAAGGLPRALVSAAELRRRGWRLASSAAAIAPFLGSTAPANSRERLLLEGTLPFAEECVPLAWATIAGGAGTETEASAVARRLEAAGLLRLGPGPDMLTVHPAVREAVSDQIAPAMRCAMRARAEATAVSWMRDALALDRFPDSPSLAHIEALASADDNEAPSPWRVALQEQLARFHRRRGDMVYAFALLDRAARMTERQRGTHGDLRAIVMAQHASLARERGDRGLASRDLTEAIAAAQGQPAEGTGRWRDVDPEAYQEAFEAVIATADALDEPADSARAAFLLADFHGRRGAWERAAPLAEQALRASRRASEPILVARAYRLLADVALHGSRYEDARASYEEAIRRLDDLGAEDLAATSRLLYINLLLQLSRRDAAVRHAEWLRGYLDRAPTGWPYHAEAVETLRLFNESATEVEG